MWHIIPEVGCDQANLVEVWHELQDALAATHTQFDSTTVLQTIDKKSWKASNDNNVIDPSPNTEIIYNLSVTTSYQKSHITEVLSRCYIEHF